jgi:hypothetical protein
VQQCSSAAGQQCGVVQEAEANCLSPEGGEGRGQYATCNCFRCCHRNIIEDAEAFTVRTKCMVRAAGHDTRHPSVMLAQRLHHILHCCHCGPYINNNNKTRASSKRACYEIMRGLCTPVMQSVRSTNSLLQGNPIA